MITQFYRFGSLPGSVLVMLLLTSCSSFEPIEQSQHAATVSQAVTVPPSLGNIEYHTAMLAQELFANMQLNREYRFAVVNFVPVGQLKFDQNQQGPLMILGHQLSEGLVSEASRRGFITQDYKTMNDIVISSNAEYVFSRDVSKLNAMPEVDFYIAGTITEQQEGAIVNARIIHVDSKDVIASATKFFPADLFWQREKVTHRQGMIYRTGS